MAFELEAHRAVDFGDAEDTLSVVVVFIANSLEEGHLGHAQNLAASRVQKKVTARFWTRS